MSFNTWLLLAFTTAGISLTPGPNALLALSHGALYGVKRTLFTILGGLVGFAIAIAFCLFGIAALIEASPYGLTVLKWIGGLYLLWIGFVLCRTPAVGVANADGKQTQTVSSYSLFRQGLISAIANPKAILLFTAFLPQFIDAKSHIAPQFVLITLTYLIIEFVVEYFIAVAADRVRPWLVRVGKRFNYVCGGMFMLVGVLMLIRN